jgi:hypothetical protein
MARKQLEDIADKAEDAAIEAKEFETLDVSKIKVEVLPETAAKFKHPFDGYPVRHIMVEMSQTVGGKKKKVPMKFNITEWVLHNQLADPVTQDPSNRNKRTYHSRSIKDLVLGINSPNHTMQFSVPITTENGTFYGALVPDPYVRCQLIFKREQKTGAIQIDKRYMLLDKDQANRLKECFLQLIKEQIDTEKAADAISAGEEPTTIRELEYGAAEI